MAEFAQAIAAATIHSPSGVPTPVVHTRLRPPSSRMGPTDDVDAVARASPLWARYGARVDAQSAREMLAARLATAAAATPGAGQGAPAPDPGAPAPVGPKPTATQKQAGAAVAGGEAVLGQFLGSRQGQAVGREVMRGIFGLLKKK
ncbi:MAG TPA: helicase HerA-like domain-containing protein [Vicinamibacterales bacterium]|nr:helicase HerA-like domain-containing protein [Vicinamibacterales bacterium]